MKKVTRGDRKQHRDINIEVMNETTYKILISTAQIKAVADNNHLQNYEDYINDKYLTGAIVRNVNKRKRRAMQNQ